jgi:hypothetical protein
MVLHRRRFKQIKTFKDRLSAFSKDVRDRASLLPPGAEKDELFRKADQADTAARLDEWVNSPGLRPPK